jgi:hypothetical protein
MFGMAVAVASLIVLTSGRNLLAQTAPQSDELRILDTTGLPMADIIIPETTGPGTQPSALFAPGIGVVGLVAPGALTGTIPPPGFPGLSYVILTEPSGEPVDPNELPPVIFTGPNGNVTVSDLLINSSAVTSPAFIALVSDNNPDLERYVSAIPAGTPVPVLVETGASQNLTPFIGPTPGLGQITVVVQSDITTVPEPSTFALAALGAAALYLVRRVGAHRKAPH